MERYQLGALWQLLAYGLQDFPIDDTRSKKYKAARSIQRAYLRHYTRRKVAARKIVEGCHNWVWKPMCKDGTIGIRPRLDLEELGITD